MTDITPIFADLLSAHSVPPTTKPAFSVDNLDEFLKEAYTINNAIRTLHTDLLRIRQSYLSTAQPRRTLLRQNGEKPLTDRDREEIDANSKKLLRDLNAKIRQLVDAEQVRRETEAQLLKKKFVRGLSALGSWASGGAGTGLVGKSVEYRRAEEAANSVNTHRESIIWTLRQRLQECVKTQQDMMEVRLNREMEKQRSVLARAGVADGMALGSMPDMSIGEPSSPSSKRRPSQTAWQQEDQQPTAYTDQDGLSPEQIQMFERENHDMLQHYQSVLGQVR
jgi:syntaxin 18